MLRKFLAVLLILFATAQAVAQGPALSRRERKDRIAKLPETYQEFVIDVEPIISPIELNAFLTLETDAQREVYITEFWRRRDIADGKTNGAFKDTYYERLDTVKSEFKQVSTDRSRMYLLHGEPDDRVQVRCNMLQPTEVWTYSYIPAIGHDVRFVFFVPRGLREYVLWVPPIHKRDDLESRDATTSGRSDSVFNCMNGDALLGAMAQSSRDSTYLLKVFEAPKIEVLEDVRKLLRTAVIATPGASRLDADFSVKYPGKQGERTDAQMTLLVPKSQLTKKEVGGASIYSLDVTGEVLRNDQMFENYRYRFDYPAEFQDQKLPVIIDRFVRPGEYKSRIRITDANSTAEVIVESDITVPEIADSPEMKERKVAAARKLEQIMSEISSGGVRLQILPLNDGLLTGNQKIETIVTGDVSGVEFHLNGRKVALRREPPYTLQLDFGNVPRSHRIKAVAIDARGQPLAGDDIVANIGSDPFSVRIDQPRVVVNRKGATRVELSVQVPAGKKLNDVQLFLNETRIATLYDEPFVQTVFLPDTQAVGYLRAVATLKDDTPPVEDLVLINTTAYMEEVDVHLIELPTTVVAGGRALIDLKEDAFKVFDEGKQVAIAKFEYVRNLPLSIGMAVDTSGSMQPRMNEAQKAAAVFFKNVMRAGDQAFLVGFDSQPTLMQKWSTDTKTIHIALARLRAEQYTALYDAIVYSLYNFGGTKGQKALIVVTDGQDTASKFSYSQALEYARRSGVPIYTIGLGIGITERDVRSKLSRFGSESGGATYYIDGTADLERIYAQIQNELRSQYLLGFYPPVGVKSGGKWREVTVQVGEGKAKTIKGYYP